MKNKWLSVLFKKIAAFFISIWVLSAIVFFLSRITPIDPLQSYYGERVDKMSEEQKDSARERLGLNDPITVQYVRWLKLALSGDFGISYKYKQDVIIVIKERIQNTLVLGLLSYVILFIGALLLGFLCAWNENKLADRLIVRLGTITSCIPEFWMALMLIFVFSVLLGWLPASGAYSIGGGGLLASSCAAINCLSGWSFVVFCLYGAKYAMRRNTFRIYRACTGKGNKRQHNIISSLPKKCAASLY